MQLNKQELIKIKGGSLTISASSLTALARLGGFLIELGRAIGSAVRRSSSGQTCSF